MLKRIVTILLCFIFMITYASSSTAANGETKYLYNIKGQLVEATNSYGTIHYDYDLNGGLVRKNLTDNMLTNSSFELNTGTSGLADGWQGNKDQGITGKYEVVAHHASSGRYAQKITGSGLGLHSQINVFQDVKINPGKTYTANSRIFVESLTNAKVNLTVDYFDAQYQFAAQFETSQNTTTSGGFLTLSVTGQAPANATYARVWLVLMGTDNDGSGTVYFDQTSLRYDPDGNMLANASFELNTGTSGLADGWHDNKDQGITGQYEVVAHHASSGQRAQKITGSGLGLYSQINAFQDTKIDPGKVYTANSRIFVESLTNAKVNLTVDYFDAQYQFVAQFETSQNTTTSGGFLTLSVTGQAPANATYARVWLVLLGTDKEGSGTVYFDQTSLRYDPDVNMLTNASFELKTGTSGLADGWQGNKDQGITGEYEVVAHHASSGRYAQKITGSGLGLHNQINVFQDVKIDPGKTYTANSRIFVESLTNAKVNLTVDYFDAQYQFAAQSETSQNTTTSGGFLTLSVTGQAPANAAYARVWLVLMGTDNDGSGTVYFDQASLRYDPDVNMLTNASFELNTGTSGLADGWQGNKDQGITGEYEVVAHHASSGQRAQKITGSGLGLYSQINAFQDTKIDPGKTYTASSRIFVESLTNAKVNLTVDYFDAQYQFAAQSEISQNTTTSGGFLTLSVTGQAPANAAYARVWLVLMGTDNNGSGIVYWDSAALQPK